MLAGEPAARTALEARVQQVARASTRGAAGVLEADDLAQSLLLALFEADARLLHSYEGRAALTTWLTAIARRHVWRAMQRATRERALADDPVAPASAPDPERATLSQATVAGVRGVLDGLPADDRLLLGLLVEQEVPAHVVAQALGITPDGVRMRKMRLLRRLAKSLSAWWP
ncbi:MAG: sigma-70 family RNA polymerase sigma factor [Myxococcales bacterium]|nr:sigma-70 family RNA polymerase sigma factor [Myxococcales bacterium]